MQPSVFIQTNSRLQIAGKETDYFYSISRVQKVDLKNRNRGMIRNLIIILIIMTNLIISSANFQSLLETLMMIMVTSYSSVHFSIR